jgi:hypothetical protein
MHSVRPLTLAVALLLAAALLAGGCSMIRLGYGQADSIAAWMVDEYFDLDQRQKHDFMTRFGRFYAWHRYEQLPDYARFLEAVKHRAQQPLAREDAVWLVEGVKARYRALVLRGVDDAAELLAALTPENIQALERQWEKDNRRFVREHRLEAPPAERERARIQRTLRQIRDWTGGLTREQEERIAALAAEVPFTQHLRHQDRLRRQREFLQLLALRGERREFAPRLRRWLLDWDQGRDPEYVRLSAIAYDRRIAFYLEVTRLLTPQQRATALNRLQNYIDDFYRLADRGAHVASK